MKRVHDHMVQRSRTSNNSVVEIVVKDTIV